MKKSKLLTVVSILVIIFSCLGLLANLALMATSGTMESYLSDYGYNIAMPTTADYAISIVFGIIQLIAEIMGVMYRSKKSDLIIGALYCLTILVNVIMSCVTIGFSFTYVFSFILPILYMWGWYQSE